MSERKNYQVKDGRVTVKNISAYWLDDITVQEIIHGTTYIVDGSYEGTETLTSKLKRIPANEEMRADYEAPDSV